MHFEVLVVLLELPQQLHVVIAILFFIIVIRRLLFWFDLALHLPVPVVADGYVLVDEHVGAYFPQVVVAIRFQQRLLLMSQRLFLTSLYFLFRML